MNIRNLMGVFVTLIWATSAQATLHIPATATFDDTEYTIIDFVGKLPSPTDFNIDAIPELSGLSGHVAGYVLEILIDAERIFLNGMFTVSLSGKYPPINGVQARVHRIEANGEEGSTGEYSNLKLRLEFDGRLRIAKDVVKSCYGRHVDIEPHIFTVVKDLTFENGQLVNVLDRSGEALAIRRQFKDPSECRSGLSSTMSPL